MAKEIDNSRQLVPIRVRSSRNRKEDMVVGVNGKIYRIQIGKPVMVPRFVADVIEQSLDADEYADSVIRDLESNSSAE